MNAHEPATRRAAWGFLLIFGLLATAIILVGLIYLKRQQAVVRFTAQAELAAIADLKVQQIVNWRRERLADASLILATPYVARRALDALAQPEVASSRQMFTGWLDSLLTVGPYERALLFDDKLNVRLVHPENASGVPVDAVRSSAEQALRTRQVTVTELHQSAEGGPVHLDFLVPLVVRRERTNDNVPAAGLDSSPADRSAGVLVLQVNAHDFLFPLIQAWPTASPSAETLLVRREGKEVLYLNELRHRKGTALNLRRPLDEARLPAAMGLRGEKGIQEGLDYRGVRVVAAMRPVPDTPWFMEAKVDEAELYAPLRREALGAGAVALALLMAAAFGVALLWRWRSEQYLHAQLALERERRASAERYEHLMKNASDAIMLTDGPNNVIEANERALTLYGYSLAELQAIKLADLCPVEARGGLLPHADELASTGRTVFETLHQRKDGSVFPAEVSGRLIEIAGHGYQLRIIRDITERKQAEATLRQSEERFVQLFAEAPLGIALIDSLTGHIYQVNPMFARIAGRTMEEMLQIDWMSITHPDDIQKDRDYMAMLNAGEITGFQMEKRYLHQDGDVVWINMTIAPIYVEDKAHPCHLCMIEDITERKQAEEKVRKFNIELEERVGQRTAQLGEANRSLKQRATELEAAVKELDAFAYSVSHDLRAPLRHINGYTGLLRTSGGPSLPDKSRHYLDEITGSATYMGRLIDELLRFSRMGRTEMRQEPLALSELVEESIAQLRPEINGRNILWKKDPLPVVQADPVLLRQVLINLFSNAIKYTRPRDLAKIDIGCATNTGQETVIFVRDNGVGFDMQYGDKLFGVFQRLHADDEFEGTGIGLANVRRIIARHGGRTWAEGKVDEGATFYFSLPIHPSPSVVSETDKTVAADGSRRT